MIEAHFSNIRKSILKELSTASESIKVAVYWFTNHELFDIVYQKQLAGIQCDLIIHNDYINNRETGLPFQKFIDAGGNLYFSDEDNPMHNKFCIIDQKVLINGSYNWTYYAESKNHENILIINDELDIIKAFTNEFSDLVNLLNPLQSIFPLTKFEVDENNLLRNRDYLAHDIIYQAKASNKPEMAKFAFEIAPQNLGVQKIANELGLTKKYKLKHSVGVLIENNNVRFIANKGAVIPATYWTIAKTSFNNQDRIDTDILFGESQKANENKRLIRKMTLSGLPKKPAGETMVKFIFSIDTNGHLRIQMISLDTGKEVVHESIEKNLIEEY